MKVKSIKKKTFQLIDNDRVLGELIYQGVFSSKAVVSISNASTYVIAPSDMFATSIKVTQDDGEVANLKMNWKGQIVMTFHEGETYVFKAKGVFHNTYYIENQSGETLLKFDPKFNWQNFKFNYDVSYDKTPENLLLVLIGIYAANYYVAVVSGSLAAV